MYKVSVIIPVYNVEQYILTSIKSALLQTFKSIEYIIIDDCGNDNSISLIREYIANHPRKKDIFIYKHDKNRGLSAARNTGLSKAKGEYIYFMDSDDEISENCIELHYNEIMKKHSDFTVANFNLVGAKSNHIKPISKSPHQSPLISYLRREWNVSACNKLYNIEFLRNNDIVFKDNLLHEDILWNYQISLLAQKIAFVEESTYIYKIREGSIVTTKNGKRKLDSLLYILNTLYTDWNNGKIEKQIEESFNSFFNYWRFVTALQLLNFDGDNNECVNYYNKISQLSIGKNNSVYSLFLKLPFWCFSMIRPIYNYYKKRK